MLHWPVRNGFRTCGTFPEEIVYKSREKIFRLMVMWSDVSKMSSQGIVPDVHAYKDIYEITRWECEDPGTSGMR